jgi:hypothetical protein
MFEGESTAVLKALKNTTVNMDFSGMLFKRHCKKILRGRFAGMWNRTLGTLCILGYSPESKTLC